MCGLEASAIPEQRHPLDPTPFTVGHLACRSQITFQPLPEYEPPLQQTPIAEAPEFPSSADFPGLSKFDAFQLALDLSWAREHRIEEPEQRIAPADLRTTHWLLNAVVEVMSHRRPLVQLRPLLNTRVFAAMETTLRISAQSPPAIRLRSVHACQPGKGVTEACGLLEQGRRVRALAARLEARRRGWLCTVLRML
jgi:hypothetical protein